MNPDYPVYIISRGRWESRLTSKSLEKMRVPYHIVIEPQEYNQYSNVIDKNKILILPFSNLGRGSIPARNWVWQHSISTGAKKHWILDDNIRGFYRNYERKRIEVDSGICFKAVEDITNKYKNVMMSGLQYRMFTPVIYKLYAMAINTRIYSCILLSNELEFRWRGRYNEDTNLSLQILKAGYCTLLIQSFVCDKIGTMTMKGGNTDELYKQDGNFDGRLEMAKELKKYHPDVVKIVFKWGRWQHSVDYRPFKNNRLIRDKSIEIDKSKYRMVLKQGNKVIER